jgi:hypothetical protein
MNLITNGKNVFYSCALFPLGKASSLRRAKSKVL